MSDSYNKNANSSILERLILCLGFFFIGLIFIIIAYFISNSLQCKSETTMENYYKYTSYKCKSSTRLYWIGFGFICFGLLFMLPELASFYLAVNSVSINGVSIPMPL